MQREPFELMVRQMASDIPTGYLDGVTEVVVSPRAVPHPTRVDIYTLGECIPLPLEGSGTDVIQSRIVLYYGSFRAVAELDSEFDWRKEAWDTLTHELQHHVEWRAQRDRLERFDWAMEQNFARQDDEPFDPLFYLDGELSVPGVFHVEDDWFIDRVVRDIPTEIELVWHGREYRGAMPSGVTLPAYLHVDGVVEPPGGDLVMVLRRAPRLRELFRRAGGLFQGTLMVGPPAAVTR
jgi:hypothetical protein